MKQNTLLSLAFGALTMLACNNGNTDNKEADSAIDSCKIAKKSNNAQTAEMLVGNTYTGELNNYWGDDTTKLDFKHVFKDGQLIKSYFYYANGIVQEKYSFKCGAMHGLQEWYYEDGKLAKTIPYNYGYRDGTGQLFDTTGHLRQQVTFKADSIVDDIKNYDESGTLINNDTTNRK